MIYTLHQRFVLGENGRLTRNIDAIEAVPEGVSVWALAVPPLWLIKHGLWFALCLYIMFALFLFGVLFTDYWLVSIALGGLPGLYLWLEGHQLRRSKLESSGFELTDIVDAPSEDVALARLVVGHSEEQSKVFQSANRSAAPETFEPTPALGSGIT